MRSGALRERAARRNEPAALKKRVARSVRNRVARPFRKRVARSFRSTIYRSVCLVLAFAGVCVVGLTPPTEAARVPSQDLRFAIELGADSVTVGDPIPLRITGAGPLHGNLVLPEFADSVGPFTVLGLDPLSWVEEGETRAFTLTGTVAAFDSGELISPRSALLWTTEESPDTFVAYARGQQVFVQSVLPESIDLSQPQTALAELKEVKDVVVLERDWRWAWITAAILLATLLFFWAWRRRRRESSPFAPEARPRPQLSPEAAFRAGLAALRERSLLEKGEVKEYYASLSMLVRAYLEGRFEILAVEATYDEISRSVRGHDLIPPEEQRALLSWLGECDLVKFAKQTRTTDEAQEQTEFAERFVAETTKAAKERARAAAAAVTESAPEERVEVK